MEDENASARICCSTPPWLDWQCQEPLPRSLSIHPSLAVSGVDYGGLWVVQHAGLHLSARPNLIPPTPSSHPFPPLVASMHTPYPTLFHCCDASTTVAHQLHTTPHFTTTTTTSVDIRVPD
jgi:hypothetical protein